MDSIFCNVGLALSSLQKGIFMSATSVKKSVITNRRVAIIAVSSNLKPMEIDQMVEVMMRKNNEILSIILGLFMSIKPVIKSDTIIIIPPKMANTTPYPASVPPPSLRYCSGTISAANDSHDSQVERKKNFTHIFKMGSANRIYQTNSSLSFIISIGVKVMTLCKKRIT